MQSHQAFNKGVALANRNYKFEKRQKDLAKQKKKQKKLERKQARKEDSQDSSDAEEDTGLTNEDPS